MHGDFILQSRTKIKLPAKTFMNGPWYHLATITRSLQEYVVLQHQPTGKVYLEEITALGHFKHIEDDSLWQELLLFANSHKILGEYVNHEVPVAKE